MKHNKYFIESPFPEVLQKLLKDPVIQECRLRKNVDSESKDKDGFITSVESKVKALQVSSENNFILNYYFEYFRLFLTAIIYVYTFLTSQFGAKAAPNVPQPAAAGTITVPEEGVTAQDENTVPEDITKFYDKIDKEDEDEEEIQLKTVSFEVNQEKIEIIQKRCIELEHPLLAEYDFRNDTVNADIKLVNLFSKNFLSFISIFNLINF